MGLGLEVVVAVVRVRVGARFSVGVRARVGGRARVRVRVATYPSLHEPYFLLPTSYFLLTT